MDGYIGSEARLYRAAPDIGHDGPEWQLDAACQEYPPDLWHVDKGGSVREAKQICRDYCTVRAQCLAFAMNVEVESYRSGVYGGLGPRERSDLADAGWHPGDPIPDVRITPPIVICPDCGKGTASLAGHRWHAHGVGNVA